MNKYNLNDLQVQKIEAFVKDTEMFDAVRKVLLASIYEHGTVKEDYIPDPLINGAFSLVHLTTNNPIPDEVIGQQLRAQWAGVNILQNAIQELHSIKSEPVESPYTEENPAV